MTENISTDVIWQITRGHHSMLCKRREAGGVQFSRDPLNLTNKHSRKYEGFIDDKAIGIQPGPNGGVTLTTKKSNRTNKPATALQSATFGPGATERKTYRRIINATTKRGYRADLRAEAIARASAIKRSQRPRKELPAPKLRGAKARKAAEAS